MTGSVLTARSFRNSENQLRKRYRKQHDLRILPNTYTYIDKKKTIQFIKIAYSKMLEEALVRGILRVANVDRSPPPGR